MTIADRLTLALCALASGLAIAALPWWFWWAMGAAVAVTAFAI